MPVEIQASEPRALRDGVPRPAQKALRRCQFGGVALRDAEYVYVHSRVNGKAWLSDRRVDPAEINNLAGAKPEVAANYRRRAKAFRRVVNEQ